MTVERGSAEGQWLTWLERIQADTQSDDPMALEIWGVHGATQLRPRPKRWKLHVSTTATTWGFEIWRDGASFEKLHEGRWPVRCSIRAACRGCGLPAANGP